MGLPKTILITGATSDFGVAFAKKFAEAGAQKIYLHGRNADKLAALQKMLPCETEILLCDLSDKQAIDTAFAGLKDIDLLINNAGGALGLEKVYEAKPEDWEQMVEANVSSLIRITRHILPDMVARRSGMSSISARSQAAGLTRAVMSIVRPKPLQRSFRWRCAPIWSAQMCG